VADTSKDFAPIQADYAFFEDHATEAAADVAGYAPHVRPLAAAGGPVRVLDFGCGSGRFSARFLTAAGFGRDQLHLTLVEPVADYRPRAVAAVSAFTAHPVAAWPALPDVPAPGFDLILANHCLYYVPDLDAALAGLLGRLAAGGVLLAACAGGRNVLVQFWQRGYARLGEPVPSYTGDDLAAALTRRSARFTTHDVWYELAFADTEENRAKIIRFLFGKDAPRLPRAEALGYFDPFAAGGRVRLRVVHEQFVVRTPA
jgi:trans-aconitate 2-methyltransferase